MDHGYRIEGNINGRTLLGLGVGKTDPATGVSEMHVSFEKLPDSWDPRTIVLMVDVRPFEGVMVQAGPKLITVTTSYEAVLEDGSTLYGTTFYPHYLPHQAVDLPSMQLLSVLSVQQDFHGKDLWVRTESEVSPLIAATADAAPAGVTSTRSLQA